uniref:Putative secreted protein n=1 Tax=Ixodes ricinus TaxID=34613 RepID=A0A6B0U271_IXORI
MPACFALFIWLFNADSPMAATAKVFPHGLHLHDADLSYLAPPSPYTHHCKATHLETCFCRAFSYDRRQNTRLMA